MQYMELKCLKNKGKLIANVSQARHVAYQVLHDVHEILDDIESLNRAILFEDIDTIKQVSQKLRLGKRDECSTYVEGFEELITTINATTAKCNKAKAISM